MIINSIKGPGEPKEPEEPEGGPTPPTNKPTIVPPPPDLDNDEEELNEEDALDRAERGVRDLGSSMDKWKTGLSLKQSGYADEQGGKLPLKELYSAVSTIKDLMLKVWVDVVNESDYKFKEYLENNEDQYTRTGAVVSMIVDELEDRLELEEPVGPDKGVEEIKKLLKL